MSCGHITGYYALPSIAEEIERLAIEQTELGPDVLGRYRMAADMARRTYEAIRAVDYLEGGDYGRESFVKAWDELVGDPASVLRSEVQRLREEARRSDAGRVEVPEPPEESELYDTMGDEDCEASYEAVSSYLMGWRHCCDEMRSRLSPYPHPSADVVVVPREIVQKAHDWIDRGAMSREANALVDELRRALRSSTNHDAQDAGEGGG